MCRNKYYGLKLCEEGFKRELITFLHNGEQLRMELLEPLLHKLRRLYKVIEKQYSYRFYSSSLLLMYEGDKEKCDKTSSCGCCSGNEQELLSNVKNSHSHLNHRSCKVDVRMIDFAHTTHSGYSGDRTRSGPDTGYLFGLKNLIRLLEEIQDVYSDASGVTSQSLTDSDTSQIN